jgi:hypothetical protein
MVRLRASYRQSTKRNMPPHGLIGCHTHNALEDAIEQGALFCDMPAETLGDTST